MVGIYVKLKDWNVLISDLDVIVIDMCNNYEIEIGIFKNVIDLKMEMFREFFEYVEKVLDFEKNKKVVMFCIGGICCEKFIVYFKE